LRELCTETRNRWLIVDASETVTASPQRPAVSPLALAVVFARISSTAFGGGQMGAIRREVVRQNRWLTEEEYLELLSVAQIAPGPNPVSAAVLIGGRLGGWPGAAASLVACTLPGFVILMGLALLALDPRMTLVRAALRGAAAAALGLTFASTWEMTLPYRKRALDLVLVVLTALAVTALHLSLAVTLAILVPVGIVLVGRRRS
jgi:chromate transporter